MKRLLVFIVLAFALVGTAQAGGDWKAMEIRGGINFLEASKHGVKGGPQLMLGLAWRQLDPAEILEDQTADGLKPVGFFAGVSFDVTDPFDLNWLQVTGGVSYEELFHVGPALWIGNASDTIVDPETGAEVTVRKPGVEFYPKGVLGVGIEGDPD